MEGSKHKVDLKNSRTVVGRKQKQLQGILT